MTKRSPSPTLLPAVFLSVLFLGVTLPALVPVPPTWHVTVGADNHDKGRQALAFLPNEIWIHKDDKISFHFDVDEIHTVSFLTSLQIRPFFGDGCPVLPHFSFGSATFDDTTCVTTPPMVTGGTFTVTFPKSGNYKVVCLVHEHMTGTVHVLDPSATLPHNQAFYNAQAADQRNDLLSDRDENGGHDRDHNWDHDRRGRHEEHGSGHHVLAGTGEVTATAGGNQTLSVLRFTHDEMVIHKGQTVEWTVGDPITPHTVTFGAEPPPPAFFPPSGDAVVIDPDGAVHATVSLLTPNAHSGFLLVAPQDQVGLPQSPIGVGRFRVTFPNVGVYPYICALHDDLGMKGTIIVKP